MRKSAFKYCYTKYFHTKHCENSFVYLSPQPKIWNHLGLFFRLFAEKKASTNTVNINIIDLDSAFYNTCKNKLIEETISILKTPSVLKCVES